MLKSYFTVKGQGSHEIEIERSRFICYVSPAKTEAEAQEFIADIKKKHWDATHNCSAYLIGEHNEIQKANDDGEPSGTAGVPMLEVLKKRDVKDTVVVVTRYFGGKKLGSGGLIRAYGTSVSEGLNAVGVIERTLVTVIHIKIGYKLLGKIENAIRNSNYHLEKTSHLEDVEFEMWIKVDELDSFKDWMVELTNGSCQITETSVKYM
ncbi:YigZ family protein [Bacillus sp. RG28]|uniref:YigZ family protein n=1 Tax=Gottfriedia endophytica TaxID=2820819 RepID=A0A940SKF4_9BACI|nr:YigZ family protein [Gottfriedia endophytica]MBP0725193.1 YigZ family protein [Gottfriedia endophytica]